MGVQFFEIFSIVQESQQVVSVPKAGIKITNRIKSVANTATGHIPLPKRFRHSQHSTEEEPEELNTLEHLPEDGGESILKDHVFSVGVAFAQVCIPARNKGISFSSQHNLLRTAQSFKNIQSPTRLKACQVAALYNVVVEN